MTNEAVLEADSPDFTEKWIVAQYERSMLQVSGKNVRLVIDLPAEYSRIVHDRIGHGSLAGENGYVAIAPATPALFEQFIQYFSTSKKSEDETSNISKSKTSKGEHGDYARKLYAQNFFLHEDVLKALGTDEEFRKWIQTQPSCVSGEFSEHVNGEGRCVAAHVRRAVNSGTGLKPAFSCVPLTQEEHDFQHQMGEATCLEKFYKTKQWKPDAASEWFWKQRCEKVTEWAKMRLKMALAPKGVTIVQSLAAIPPAEIQAWAETNNLTKYLPTEPRE